MNNILEKIVIWADENPIVFIVILVEAALLFYIIMQLKERHDQKKTLGVNKANAKMRRLTTQLTNPRWLKRQESMPEKYIPYESRLHEFEEEETDFRGMQVELATEGPFASENYLVNVGGGITLGSGDGCEVVITDPDVALKHCKILQDRTGLLIRRIDENHITVIERGMKFFKLYQKEVRLQDKDRIKIGGSTVTISVVQNQ